MQPSQAHPLQESCTSANEGGFTLLEMSIVLVIIGLIIGGIMTGRALIASAEIRKVGSLINQIDISVNAFKLKYNCLPGDCASATSLSLGTNGNGNGHIFSVDGDGNGNNGLENYQFWMHLIAANFLPDQRYCILFPSWGTGAYGCSPTSASFGYYGWGAYAVPGFSRNDNATPMIQIFNVPGWLNMYANTSSYTVPYQHVYAFMPRTTNGGISGFSTSVTQELDAKFDDGLPLSGTILALSPKTSTGWTDDSGFSTWSTPLSCMDRTTTPYQYKSGTNFLAGCTMIWRGNF